MEKIKLIDYIDNTSGNFLFLHPQSIGSYNIVSFLVSLQQMVGKSVTIVTDDKDKINRCLPGPLPDDNYIKYKDVKGNNFDNGYLIIDDYQLYLDNKISENVGSVKIIVLTKGNIKLSGEWNIIYLLLCEDGPILKHNLVIIEKSETIKSICNKILLNINNKHLITGKKSDYPILSKFSNIVYTDDSLSNQDITNIEMIHVNKVKLDYYLRLVNAFYKRQLLSDTIDVFEIIFYIDVKDNEAVENYNKIINYIEEYEKNYTLLLSKSVKINYSDELGVYVEISKK